MRISICRCMEYKYALTTQRAFQRILSFGDCKGYEFLLFILLLSFLFWFCLSLSSSSSIFIFFFNLSLKEWRNIALVAEVDVVIWKEITSEPRDLSTALTFPHFALSSFIFTMCLYSEDLKGSETHIIIIKLWLKYTQI